LANKQGVKLLFIQQRRYDEERTHESLGNLTPANT
jgi:hypothetical protein